MDFIGQGDAQKGYTGFAWIIAIAFIVLTGITVCNVKSADGAKTEKKEKTSFKHMLHIIVKNDQLLPRLLGYLFILKWYINSQELWFMLLPVLHW